MAPGERCVPTELRVLWALLQAPPLLFTNHQKPLDFLSPRHTSQQGLTVATRTWHHDNVTVVKNTSWSTPLSLTFSCTGCENSSRYKSLRCALAPFFSLFALLACSPFTPQWSFFVRVSLPMQSRMSAVTQLVHDTLQHKGWPKRSPVTRHPWVAVPHSSHTTWAAQCDQQRRKPQGLYSHWPQSW